jgi:hypothetical protein
VSSSPADARGKYRRAARRRWAVLAAIALVATGGVLAHMLSPGYAVAPVPGLRQLDLLYLDEPAPGLEQLGVQPGRPAVVVFCDACDVPEIAGAQVLQSDDAALAAHYALITDSGRVGPGYALIDASGQLRYRTFDPDPGRHAAEIQIVVDALREEP